MALILGIAGMVGSGKTTVSGNFIQTNGFRQLSFADPIRDTMMALGVPLEVLRDPVRKEQPHPALAGATPRAFMEGIGKLGRDLTDGRMWLNKFSMRADLCDLVICDDVRYQNEVDEIAARGGQTFRLVVPGREPRVATDHSVLSLSGVEDITNDIGRTKIADIYAFIYGRLFQTIARDQTFDMYMAAKNG